MTKWLLLMMACAVSSLALAQSSEVKSSEFKSSGLTTSDLRLREALRNKKFEDNHEITDTKLRAEAGSLSRYSFKFDLTYVGAGLETPFAAEQPNPENLVRMNSTFLTGAISGRLRISPNSSGFVSSGLSAIHPFHGTDRWDVKNPALGYDFYDRIGDTQMRLASMANAETTPELRRVGGVGGATFIGSLVRDLGTSGFALGLDAGLIYKFYERNYDSTDGYVPRDTVFVSPGVKYNFTDQLSLATNWSKPFMSPRSVSDEWALKPMASVQRVSLAYGFSKTVYFAPYLSLYPESFSLATTQLNLTTVFSVL